MLFDVAVVVVLLTYTLFVLGSLLRDRNKDPKKYGQWTMIRKYKDSEGSEIAVFRWKP